MKCKKCELEGGVYHAKCVGCAARKIINLRTPNGRLSKKFQLVVLGSVRRDLHDEVFRLIAEHDAEK